MIKNAGWNASIPAGGRASFGFNGSAGNVGANAPANYKLNGVPLGGTTPTSPTLNVAGASINEGNAGLSNLTFTVSLNPPSASAVTVDYTTADGSATAGTDYLAKSGTITFAPGVTSQVVAVSVIGDITPEANESFVLKLSNPAGGATIGQSVATGTIANDDTFPLPLAVPATPSLSIETVAGHPDQLLAKFNIWWGQNATSWTLLENGRPIATVGLTASSPNAQSSSYTIAGKTYGAFQYQAVATNAAGSTSSNTANITVGGASKIIVAGADLGTQVTMVTVPLGTTTFALSELGAAGPTFQVITNNATVAKATMSAPGTLSIVGLTPGFSSVRIVDPATGEARFLGIRVMDTTGALPGMPNYLAVGSVGEDTPTDLAFFRDYGAGDTDKRLDVRYVYLNGGPVNGWRTWGSTDGGRLTSYLRESRKLGVVPYLVYYNIPDGGESYTTDLEHISSRSYMQGYFTDLKFALDIIKAEAPDSPVGMILEPDFLGYLMQNSGKQPDQIAALTDAVYDVGALTRGIDPTFANTVQGLVNAINYLISKSTPNVNFGWQFNLWASPGITTPIPGNGLMHITDTKGIAAGRRGARERDEGDRRVLHQGGRAQLRCEVRLDGQVWP